jgi:hypothetical protein
MMRYFACVVDVVTVIFDATSVKVIVVRENQRAIRRGTARRNRYCGAVPEGKKAR